MSPFDVAILHEGRMLNSSKLTLHVSLFLSYRRLYHLQIYVHYLTEEYKQTALSTCVKIVGH
jgi:hypothetical protein